MFTRIASLSVFASVIALSSAAQAKAETPDAEGVNADIVVTATRRPQTITDIPIAVTAVAGDSIAVRDVRDLSALASSIPNFKLGTGGLLGPSVVVRGLGSGQDRTFEQAVGLYVDGVYIPRSNATRAALFDVERVEVMRGPQAVLQGLNSTAGAISVISRKARPGEQFSLNLTGGAEFLFGGFNLEGATSFSPTDWLGARIAVRYGEDGAYYRNIATGQEENKRKDFTARVTLTAALSDSVDFTVKAEHAYYYNYGSEGEAVGAPSPLVGLFPPLKEDGVADWQRTATGNIHKIAARSGFVRSPDIYTEFESNGVTADLTAKLGGGTLTLLGAYYKSNWDQELDADMTDASFFEGGNYEKYDQTSFSLEYASPSGKPLEYMVGAYYQRGNLDFEIPIAIDPSALTGIPLGIGYKNFFTQDSELYSFFGTATYHLTDALRVVGGLRYVHDRKDVNTFSSCSWRSPTDFSPVSDAIAGVPVYAIGLCSDPGLNVPGGVDRSRSTDPVMYEASVQYDLTPGVMAYAKYSTSSKSGGFTSATETAPADLEFDDEKAKGAEVGIKARLLDNRMTLSLAAFRTDFKGLQLKSDVVDPNTGQTHNVISNAGNSRSQGLELELNYVPSSELSLQANVGYLDGKFTHFDTAPCGQSNTPRPGATACDFSGRQMPFAADWTGSVAVQWRPSIASGVRAVIAPELQFSSSYYTEGTLDQNGFQDGWAKINARIGVESEDGRWSVSLVGKNLTNNRIITGFQPIILYPIKFYETRRTLSLRVSYRM
jgi:outer membrane receptor protein involved in Fe transport